MLCYPLSFANPGPPGVTLSNGMGPGLQTKASGGKPKKENNRHEREKEHRADGIAPNTASPADPVASV